jgi:hypothetical protein
MQTKVKPNQAILGYCHANPTKTKPTHANQSKGKQTQPSWQTQPS